VGPCGHAHASRPAVQQGTGEGMGGLRCNKERGGGGGGVCFLLVTGGGGGGRGGEKKRGGGGRVSLFSVSHQGNGIT